ncbi:hypothetical protein [Paenibacillus sp. HW567]|uniref:hypothetical protein n=1 Tax=Paenibacillus sp. HW567 TaxID=1034769 RepID=UPI00037935BD|nr:hypothetical protein [Paenibacillus sp. HW567]
MKNTIKKSFLLFSAAAFLFGATGLTQVGAKDSSDSTFESYISDNQLTRSQVQQKLTNNLNEIETYMETQGTTVLNELIKEKERLEKDLENEASESEKSKLADLIAGYDTNITEYENYISQQNSSKGGFSTAGATDPVLSPAVSSVIAFFNLKGYLLASELLTYAKQSSIGGSYTPYYKSQANGTAELARLRTTQSGSGSGAFSKGSSTKDNDLYYAIHNYNYNWRNGTVSITDRYDYAVNPEYQGIAGTAVNTMYLAQQSGVIVPYTVVMNF